MRSDAIEYITTHASESATGLANSAAHSIRRNGCALPHGVADTPRSWVVTWQRARTSRPDLWALIRPRFLLICLRLCAKTSSQACDGSTHQTIYMPTSNPSSPLPRLTSRTRSWQTRRRGESR